jgi:tetratricopeptide (TPR) repeat protein
VPQYVAQRGVLLNALGRLEEAAEELHRALALLAAWPDVDLDDAGLRMELAHNRIRAGNAGAAIDLLTTAAARFDRRGEAVRAAHARVQLGQALLHADRIADAVAVLESLLDEEGEAELPPPERAQLRLDLGRALMQQDEPRTAAEVLTRLAEFVADWPDRAVVTLVAAEVGTAVYAAHLWEQGAATVERALAAHAEAPNPAAVCKMLRAAAEAEYREHGAEGVERALELLRRSDEVNEAAAEVEGEYRRWPETALNADTRVQALASVRRDEEALAAADAAIAAWRGGGDRTVGEVAESVRVAAIIEGFRLGRTKEAGARLAAMIDRCRAVGHERAVTVLTKLSADLQQQQ